MKYEWKIALRRAFLGGIVASLVCLNEKLSQGLLEVDLRKCGALFISGVIAGLIVDFEIYKKYDNN